MLKTEVLLAEIGLEIADIKDSFSEVSSLIDILEQPFSKETSATVQTVDLKLAQYLGSQEAREKLSKITSKAKRTDFSREIEKVQEEVGKTGEAGAFLDEDELAALFEGDMPSVVIEEEVKLLVKKTFSRIDISEFFSFFSMGEVPMVSEDLNLIVRKGDLVIEAVFNDQFKAAIQVQAEPSLPLHSMNVDVVVSSYNKMAVDKISYGNRKPLVEEVEAELPKEVNDGEISSLFSSQFFNGKDYTFRYVLSEIKDLDEQFSNWDLPVGATISPVLTPLSNYVVDRKKMYGLVKGAAIKQVGLRTGSYTTNSCEASKNLGVVIYERSGGSQFNFDLRGEKASNLIKVDEQFESFIAPKLNQAIEDAAPAYQVGFSPINGLGESGINHGGYLVYSAEGQDSFMFIPAIVCNYFEKHYDSDSVASALGDSESIIVIFMLNDLVVGLYELPMKLAYSIDEVSQIFPSNAAKEAESTYSKNTLKFLNKIELPNFLQEENEKEIEIVSDAIVEGEIYDDSWNEIIADANLMIEMAIENPEIQEFREDAVFLISILEESGLTEVAENMKLAMSLMIDAGETSFVEEASESIEATDEDENLDDLDLESVL